MPNPTKQVVCLVFEQEGKLLLEQRLDEDDFQGDWMFTGGKIETEDEQSDDPIHQAAVREGEEETGLTPIKTRVFTRFDQELRNGKIYHFIGVHVQSWTGELQNREVGRRNLVWVEISKVEGLIGDHEVDRRVFLDYMASQEASD